MSKKVTEESKKTKKDIDKVKTTKKEVNPKVKEKSKNKEKTGFFKFIKEAKEELKKVKWPSRKDMTKYSVATIVFIVFFSAFFLLIEVLVALLKTWV